MKELKEKFMEKDLSLISTFMGPKEQIFKTFNYYSAIFEYCNYIDFKIISNATNNLQDQLKRSNIFDLLSTIDDLIKIGAPPSKMLIGFSFLGISLPTDVNLPAMVKHRHTSVIAYQRNSPIMKPIIRSLV